MKNSILIFVTLGLSSISALTNAEPELTSPEQQILQDQNNNQVNASQAQAAAVDQATPENAVIIENAEATMVTASAEESPVQPNSAFDSYAISESALSEYRGGAEVVNNTNNQKGDLYNNKAIGNITGGNFVTDSAFTGASGLSTVIQNSGNNVLIQNSTILNLQVQ